MCWCVLVCDVLCCAGVWLCWCVLCCAVLCCAVLRCAALFPGYYIMALIVLFILSLLHFFMSFSIIFANIIRTALPDAGLDLT